MPRETDPASNGGRHGRQCQVVQHVERRAVPDRLHAAQGHDVEIAAQDDQQQQPDPPVRHGVEQHRADPDHVIRPAPAVERRDDAQWDADRDADEEAGEGQQEGRRDALGDQVDHRLALVEERAPEIQAQDAVHALIRVADALPALQMGQARHASEPVLPGHPYHVLHEDRAVEAIEMLEAGHVDRRAPRVGAQELQRPARRRLIDREADQRGDPHQNERLQPTPDDVS